MSRCLLLLLLLAAPAFAQTTTTCVDSSAAELQAAVSADPDWNAIMVYAARKHFDIANPINIKKCSGDAGLTFVGQLRTMKHTGFDAFFRYSANAPTAQHTELRYNKSRYVVMTVTQAVTYRITVSPLDGSIKRMILLDYRGHRLRPDTTTTTLAPAARPRGSLQ